MLNLFLLKSFAALDRVGGVVCSKGVTQEPYKILAKFKFGGADDPMSSTVRIS